MQSMDLMELTRVLIQLQVQVRQLQLLQLLPAPYSNEAAALQHSHPAARGNRWHVLGESYDSASVMHYHELAIVTGYLPC
jgi:hypothetical protein